MILIEQINETYKEAMRWWVSHSQEQEIVEDLAVVAIESAEEGEWNRAQRAANACAREAEDCLGYPDAGWEAFRDAIEKGAACATATQNSFPLRINAKRTIPAMPRP